MGTVGISFGSPTSGQGFDVSSTVSQIVANLQAVETPWQTQLSSLQAQDTALTSIGTDLSTLSSALAMLTAVQGVLSEKEGSSSDQSVLTLTGASSSAVAGSYTITVNSLAATSSYASTATASGDTLAIGSSFAINGKTITIDSSNDTLSSLATSINNGQYGVTANVLNTSAGQVLSLVSQTSGAAGDINVTNGLTDASGSAINFTQAQAGADASLTLDNFTITSPSNTVTEALDFTQSSGAVTSLTQLGVSVNNDGTLSLDTSTLSGELNSNYQDVVNFFQVGNGFTSFGDNLSSVMNTLGNSAPNGEIFLGLQQYSTQESTLNTNISNENALISTQQSALTTELNEANFTLEQIPTQLQAVNEIYSAITGFNQNPQG